MRVFVYFNLHKKTFSLKALEGPRKGLVVAHRNDVVLENVSYKVSEAGRQRVLRERAKNVHAGIVGFWDEEKDTNPIAEKCLQEGVGVMYNPYKTASFFEIETGTPVQHSNAAVLRSRNQKASVLAIH